jgi:hypothetical protein
MRDTTDDVDDAHDDKMVNVYHKENHVIYGRDAVFKYG